MAIYLDITEDVRYQQGYAKGYAEGFAKGFAISVEEGMRKKDIIVILNMKRKDFSVEMMIEILKITPEFAQDTLTQLEKEAEITAALKAPGADHGAVSKKLGISPLLAEVLWEEMTEK